MVDRSVLIRLGLDPSQFNRGLAVASTSARAFVRDLDSSNDRMSLLVQSSLALGPALVPIGAAGAGAIAGLANSLGAAAAGAGIAIFAFQGVGDALKALNDFQLEPTDAHFQKLHETMAELGPDGQRFVLFLQEAAPELERLQSIAQAGLLPGVQEGLTSLLDNLPQVERVVTSLSTAIGDMAAEGGEALSSGFWQDFLQFVATDGRDALVTMGKIIGNLIEGAAGLVKAFDPLSDDIGDALLDQARGFAEWADKLDDTQGFQDFVGYVRDVGPDAWQALGAIANALVEIAKAAAPVGAVSLPILEAIADTISAIAHSPAGPVLIATAAGISAISRAVALYNAASGGALSTLLFGKKGDSSANGLLGGTVTSKQAAIRGTAAAIGVLALSLTDLDEKLGVSNTANFALIGGILGPYGAAVGGLAGAVKDLSAANNDLEDSMRRVDDVASADVDLKARAAALDSLRSSAADLRADLGGLSLKDATPSGVLGNIGVIFGNDQGLSAAEDRAKELAIQNRELQTGISEFTGDLMAQGVPAIERYTSNIDDLQTRYESILPALQASGYSIDQINHVLTTGEGWDSALNAVRLYTDEQDSLAGRTGNVIGAISGLDDQLTTTADSADSLRTALDQLLNPQLNLEAATDQYTLALRHLRDDLAPTVKELEDGTKVHLDNARALKGNSDAAITNRAAIRDRVVQLTDVLSAEAAAGTSADDLARKMRNQRRNLIDAADAANLNRDEVKDLIRQYGLTPKLVQTVIDANTDPARRKLSEWEQMVDRISHRTITVDAVFTRHGVTDRAAGGYMGDPYGFPAFHPVGLVSGGGSTTSDDVPARVSRREFVQNAWATDHYGVDAMYAINAGVARRDSLRGALGLAAGGSPTYGQAGQMRVVASSGPNVNVTPTFASRLVEGHISMRDGEPYFRGMIRDEIAANDSFQGALARQG